MSDPVTTVLVGMSPVLMGVLLLVAFFLSLFLGRRMSCPVCAAQLPGLVSPRTKTRRQWLEGGQTCPHCGTDVDVRGRKVEGPRVLSRRRLWMPAGTLVALVGVTAGLLYLALRPSAPPEPLRPGPEAPVPAPFVAPPPDVR